MRVESFYEYILRTGEYHKGDIRQVLRDFERRYPGIFDRRSGSKTFCGLAAAEKEAILEAWATDIIKSWTTSKN